MADKSVKEFSKKNKIIMGAIAFGFIILVLPLGLIAMKSKTNIAPKAAVMANASYLVLSTKEKTVENGKSFVVDVNLVNDQDMAYVVTGVDAIIKYDPTMVEPVKITNGSVFESLTSQKIDKIAGTIEISGSYSSIKDEAGNPKGYDGQGGEIASISFSSKKLGATKMSFIYRGGQDTTDSNIVAFKKDTLVSGQMPQERFLQRPIELSVEIISELVACKEECPGIDGVLRSCTPPEADGTSSDSICSSGFIGRVESCGGIDYCCSRSSNKSSDPIWSTNMSLCQNSSPTPTPSVTPTPVPLSNRCEPCNGSLSPSTPNSRCAEGLVCMYDKTRYDAGSGITEEEDIAIHRVGSSGFCVKPSETVASCNDSSPTPAPMPRPEASIQLKLDLSELAQDKDKYQNFLKGTLYGVDAGSVKGVMVATALGDLNDESDAQSRYIPGTWAKPIIKSGLVKISDFTVDMSGAATVTIPQEFEGKRMYLFVRTQSHLRKASGRVTALPSIPDCLWQGTRRCKIAMKIPTVEFNNLMVGDIYIANGQLEQDNVINTFDAMDLIRSLGESSSIVSEKIRCFKEPCPDSEPILTLHRADLNADSIVNIRDLKILMDNFNEKGDEPSFSSTDSGTYYKRL